MDLLQDQAGDALVRAQDLLSQMTFAEKAAQMVQISLSRVTWEEAELWAKERGAGSFLHAVGDEACRLQGFAGASRLKIPLLMGIDAIHGHALNNGATVFPTPLALACSFSPELAEAVAAATAVEVAADGLHWVFSPLLCQARDLRWGRVGETFGEDGFLIGELATAMVRGYQGQTLAAPGSVLACLKHYIAYGESTGGRDSYDAPISCRMVRETFLPPFRKAVKAGAASVMTAYHSIDGTPCAMNKHILNEMLRRDLGFDGILVTDWSNAESLVTQQHAAEDIADSTLKHIATTHNIIMNTPAFYEAALTLRESGQLAEDSLNALVLPILIKKIELGLLDDPQKTPSKLTALPPDTHIRNQSLALQAAEGSMVLLKNEKKLLPLRHVGTIALVGPAADSVRGQFGDWTFFTHPEPDETRKPLRRVSTFKEGLSDACHVRGIRLLHHKGCDFLGEWSDIEGALHLAEHADLILCCLGDCLPQIGEIHDRSCLELSGQQNDLIQALQKTGKPVIGLLCASKPLVISRMAAVSDAMICAFNPGEKGGEALARLLFGEAEFTGRLPISFPRATGQLPVYYNHLPGWHTNRYMDCEAGPLFAFGEGLSYTRFAYEGLTLAVEEDGVRVHVTLRNEGTRAGTETVQFYVHDMVASFVQPVRKLAGFAKVTLAAGERKTVSHLLPRDAFTLVNENGETVLESGAFDIQAGHSSREDDLLCAQIML